MTRSLLWTLLLSVCLVQPAAAIIIDHNFVDQTKHLPGDVMEKVGQQRWFFAHASVGWNMVIGLRDLHAADPDRYQIAYETVAPGSSAPATTTPGTVYESYRGNPGWQEKIDQFETSLRTEGWSRPAVDIVLNKFCYDDDRADPQPYLDSMTQLETEFPGTIFVYATMPLRFGDSSFNVSINRFNDVVREHCAAKGLILLDVADIECHKPDGTPVLFESGGESYQMLNPDYSSDGGHLNAAGSERMALAWYAAAAAMVAMDVSGTDAPSALAADIASVTPNPFNPATVIRWSLAADGDADLAVVDLRGRLVRQLHSGTATAGDHETTWRGTDTAGRAVGSGVYLLRLQAGGQVSHRSMTLLR
ncbi:MAG: T9SS type A sorting domain-containing protein [bacterium]|nr:T9SS type A sorting domain-containing protein [bacterium]